MEAITIAWHRIQELILETTVFLFDIDYIVWVIIFGGILLGCFFFPRKLFRSSGGRRN